MLRPWPIAICATILFLGTVENNAEGQYAESCRAPAPSGVRGSGNSSVESFVELVPSLCVSERYDSNVFFRPSTAGLNREDYVTSVNPMLRVNHNGNYASGYLDVGGISETYVNNSGLNYMGSNGTLFLNLDNTVKKLIPRGKLMIADAVSYVPTPPGFVNPLAGTSPGAPANFQDIFAQGILVSRTDRVTNSGTVSGAYDISALVSVNGSYSHSTLRFLSSQSSASGNAPTRLFNTVSQTGSVGASTQISNVDQLNLRYSHTMTELERDSAAAFSFKTNVVSVSWSRMLAPNVTAEAGGGGIFIDPGRVTYAANGTLTMNFPNTRVTLGYARSAFPSFAGVPTQVVGDVVSLSALQVISSQWELAGTVNYSHSSGRSNSSVIKHDSYGGSVTLAYLMTRLWTVALGYSYLSFDREFSGLQDQFNRHTAMLSVRASWE